MGWLHNLENGHYLTPSPDRLQRLADVLGVDFEDLYALASYDRPERLPSFGPYLRARYDELPDDVIADVEAYFQSRARGGER
jgi:transcriptional regulator with XRE-family HTH domain